MTAARIDIEQIGQLISIAERYGLEELTVSEGSLSVTIRGFAPPPAAPDQAAPAVSAAAPPVREPRPAKPRPATEAPVRKRGVPLPAPMTGVFYRAPSPDAPPFVDVGDVVTAGQTIGLIEAMKVFSEVPAEVAGRIVEIVAESGKLVQADEPLMFVEPVEDLES
jgi:acetyl-CoA carboxylase biotin carboxyl carrier protein